MADDFTNDISTTGVLALGGTATGDIETGGDQDWFRISLNAGTTYHFNLRGMNSGGGTLVDPIIHLINSAGTNLQTIDTELDEFLYFTPTTSGTYFVGASGYESQTGTYTLQARAWPILTVTAGAVGTYTEHDTPVLIASDATISDEDSANLTSMTVSIADFRAQDMLMSDLTPGLASVYNLNTGTLTITGSASVADYQAVLRTLVYYHTGDNPTLGGTDTTRVFDISVSDGTLIASLAPGIRPGVQVIGVNDAPVAAGDAFGVDEDSSRTFDVLANDSDPDGDTLSVSILTQAAHGTVIVNADQTVTYTPTANYHGADGFTYTASDGNGGSHTATVNVTVNAVDDLAVFGGDLTGAVEEDGSLTASGTVTVSDADGAEEAGFEGSGYLFEISGPNNGPANPLVLSIDVIFNDQLDYLDETSGVTVNALNATVPSQIGFNYDSSNSIIRIGGLEDTVLAVYSGAQDIFLRISGMGTNNPLLQTLHYSIGDGTFYSPAVNTATYSVTPLSIDVAGIYGTFTFTPGTGAWTYELDNARQSVQALTEGQQVTDTMTVTSYGGDTQAITVTITGKDEPLTAPATRTLTLAEDVPSGPVVIGAVDPDGGTLTYSIKPGTEPALGTVTFNGDTFTYTPYPDSFSSDSFVILIDDGNGGMIEQLVEVEITPVPDAPAAQDDALNLAGDAPFVIASAALLANDSDGDGDPLTVIGIGGARNGTVAISGGNIVFTPAAGYTGTSGSFEYTVSDGNGGTDTARVTLTFDAAVPSPVIGEPDLSPQWLLLAESGFVGSVGGTGAVYGTEGAQDITVLDLEGTVLFDGSFNRGGDILRLSGDAASWSVALSASHAVLSDGDTFVVLPGGPNGMAIVFDDGLRELVIAGDAMLIGDQAIGEDYIPITTAADGSSLPAGGDADARADLLLMPGGTAALGGNLDIFGTMSAETIAVQHGNMVFDPSFNFGGDTVSFDEAAGDFMAVLDGSTAVLEGSGTWAAIPGGPAGLNLSFDGDERTMAYDLGADGLFIGVQEIGIVPVSLTVMA